MPVTAAAGAGEEFALGQIGSGLRRYDQKPQGKGDVAEPVGQMVPPPGSADYRVDSHSAIF